MAMKRAKPLLLTLPLLALAPPALAQDLGGDGLLDDESWWESVALAEDDVLVEDEAISTDVDVDVGVEPGPGPGTGTLQMGPMDLLSPVGEPLRIGPPTAPGPGGILR
ncbi:MAG TPA: hypothetical protein VLS89_11865 [Candidatus Nanopelagicales bacterium]|nr:hypothetical protein [Candidatus Nanopelagicales bacterium]